MCFSHEEEDCDGSVDFYDPDCGLTAQQIELLTSPVIDTDLDGMRNRDEFLVWWYNFGVSDPENLLRYIDTYDLDGDRLPDGMEMLFGTDPMAIDSIPQSLLDLLPDWELDSDGDGLSNGLETMVYGTNPVERDTDADGFDDATEIVEGASAINANNTPANYGVILGSVNFDLAPAGTMIGVNGLEVCLYQASGGEAFECVNSGSLATRSAPGRATLPKSVRLSPSEEQPLKERYQLDVTAQSSSGTTIVRVDQEDLSTALINLQSRPGDLVTAGIPGVIAPDGMVTLDDARHVLKAALKQTGYPYASAMDVISTARLHKQPGALSFGQDGSIDLEDALAILLEAKRTLTPPLPTNDRGLKASKTVTLNLGDGSGILLLDEAYQPILSAAITGLAVVEILSYPFGPSGSAFRLLSFEAMTEEPKANPWKGPGFPLRYHLRMKMDPEDASEALGTISLQDPAASLYSFSIDNFLLDIDLLAERTLRTVFSLVENYPWAVRSSLRGGDTEDAPIRFHIGFGNLPLDWSPTGEDEDWQTTLLLNFE